MDASPTTTREQSACPLAHWVKAGGLLSSISGVLATCVVGALNNYGRITSVAGMSVSAGSINNYGTLGSTNNLRLTTPDLLNQNGLLFWAENNILSVNWRSPERWMTGEV
ncbi:hypothetical protein NUH87_30240 [Pseudomonas batumici]|uniref:hypothetical protein n=1 Tax=Pseudomonas batumici TaxID=226910 RepID=UPI0030D22DA7